MERPRTKSFNPEASTFSPVFSSLPPQDMVTSPNPPQDAKLPFAMEPMFSYSPFHEAGSARSLYRRDSLTPVQVCLEDFFSQDGQAILKKKKWRPENEDNQVPQNPKPTSVPVREVALAPKSNLPLSKFPEPPPEPSHAYTPVDIDELSAGLGLPSAKNEPNQETSTIASHESQVSQAYPGALYGKLIGWALDKPLTAKGLAKFLQKQDVSPAETVIRSTNSNGGGSQGTQALAKYHSAETTPTKSMSNATQSTKTPSSRRAAILSPPESIARTKGRDPAVHHQHRRNSSAASFRQHTCVPSRRYPRRPSRAKRGDQGPMPSAADIYPDDAHWTPSAPLYEARQDYISHNQSRQVHKQLQIVVANPFNWPSPSQFYAPEPPPTLIDICAADADVLKLIAQLPEPSLCTLAKLGNTHDLRATSAFGPESVGLKSNERALTPGQEDGSRYGIRFWGIGYGDHWELPKVKKLEEEMFSGETLRVSPVGNEGWSGMQTALARGWGH